MRPHTLPEVIAVICVILTLAFSILPDSNSHSSGVGDYNGEMASRNVPLINESLPAIGWSEDVRLTNDTAYSVYPDIALEGRNVHVVWEHYGNETGEWKYHLKYKRSTDGGLTWDDGLGNISGTRLLLDLGDMIPLVSARIGVNGSNVHIAYYGRHGNFWWPSYINSTTNGETWSQPVMIGNRTDGCPGGLDIAVAGGNIHIAWIYGSNPLDSQVYYSMSSDGGASWSNATKMSSLPRGSQRPAVAVEGNKVHLVYLDMDSDKMYYKRSLDNGKSWDDGMGNIGSQRLLFSDSANLSVISEIAASDGRVHTVWNKEIPHSEWNESEGVWQYVPYYQMLYTNSEDNGGNWSSVQVLVNHTDVPFNTWGEESYGHTVSVWDIEALGNSVHVVSGDTRDDKSTCEVYYKKSTDGGRNWTGDTRVTLASDDSFNPRVAVDYGRIHLVWMDQRDDNNPWADSEEEIYYKRYPAFGPPPPVNLSANLEGVAFEDVNISWERPVTGGNESSVYRYDIYYGDTYNCNGDGYALLVSLQASNDSHHYYVHGGAGEGDPDNYFYYVCSVNSTNHSSCAFDQAGKFTYPVSKGPSLVSIPLIQSDEGVQTVLQTVQWDKAWSYDSSVREWKWYMKYKPYEGELERIDISEAYWISITESSNLTVAGIVPVGRLIGLNEGWNLVGFPSFREDYTVVDLKSSTATERIEVFDALCPPYYLGLMSDGDTLQAGVGYWIKVRYATVWTVESS
jgi:hypothetical protein